jgi:acetyltransferase-like isoleucine patch superfamily enzyme
MCLGSLLSIIDSSTLVHYGVCIGENVIEGIGNIVTHDVLERGVVAGHAARLLRWITEGSKKYPFFKN